MPNVGNPEYGCDSNFDLNKVAITKETSQLQISHVANTAFRTRVLEGAFTTTATDFFTYQPETESFVCKKTTTFALLGFYIGTGWSGGSTGKSAVHVAVNENPLPIGTNVNEAQTGIAANGFSVNLNFPVGQEEAGASREFETIAGHHLQLFTNRSGNEGGSNLSGSDDPDLFEFGQIIFIER